MKTRIYVDNLKCVGCADTIRKALISIPEVSAVNVDNTKQLVEVEYPGPFSIDNKIKTKLSSIGYPEKGTLHGLEKIGANLKSYLHRAAAKVR